MAPASFLGLLYVSARGIIKTYMLSATVLEAEIVRARPCAFSVFAKKGRKRQKKMNSRKEMLTCTTTNM